MEEELAIAKVDMAKVEEAKKKMNEELQIQLFEEAKDLELVNTKAAKVEMLQSKVVALETANTELEQVNAILSSQLLKVQDQYFYNQVVDFKMDNYLDLLSQKLTKARITVVDQKKDNARRLKKR